MRIVEVGGRIERVEFLGDLELRGIERTTFFLEIGLAEVGTQQRVVRVQRDRGLEVAPTLVELALADLRQTEAEARQRIGRIQRRSPVRKPPAPVRP